MKAFVLELSGGERFRLLSVIEAAIYAGKQEINAFLQEEPWAEHDWTIDDLLADPAQVKQADPHDDYAGSDLRALIVDLQDAIGFASMLDSLQGRCEQCGTPSEKLFECDKAYLCDQCSDKWENE
jgi:hypothetical protein